MFTAVVFERQIESLVLAEGCVAYKQVWMLEILELGWL